MAQQVEVALQEEGWPLGLQPLSRRAGVSGSISFNTLITSSPGCNSLSSSDLDTESSASFFPDNSITLGNLIGLSSILKLSRSFRSRSTREASSSRSNKGSRSRGRFVCLKNENSNNAPSLGHFLEVERKASTDYKKAQSPKVYDTFVDSETNLPLINGHASLPRSRPPLGFNIGGRHKTKGSLVHFSGCGVPVLCSCMRGQATN